MARAPRAPAAPAGEPQQVQNVDLQIPRHFKARSYQREFFRAMRAGCKRAALVWHRRAGKDVAVINRTIEAMLERVGTYYYFLPTYAQGAKIIWDGIQADGTRFLDHFPPELIAKKNETAMRIEFTNGSAFQVVGADKIDSIVGTNPVGVVFSEYSLMSPAAWDLIRPILAENGGWAIFVFTPRGRNWGWKLWQSVQGQHGWFTSMRTVDQTLRDSPVEDGTRVVSQDAIDGERAEGMAEELIAQEFYCSFEGAILGSYYGDLIEKMREQGRVTGVPWNRDHLVDTAWDLGVNDETVVLFTQDEIDRTKGTRYLALVDVMYGRSKGLSEYWREMKSKPYTYGRHFGPHDLKVQEFGSGNTRLETAWKLGLSFEVVPKLSLPDGINAVRRMLPYLYVDDRSEQCVRWLDALMSYRREFDEKTQSFRNIPLHDWTSNYADAARYRAIAYHGIAGLAATQTARRPSRANTEYSVFEPGPSSADPFKPWSRNNNAEFQPTHRVYR